jgi:ATP-dependent exoDNAse (exonuclease V) beta subunit
MKFTDAQKDAIGWPPGNLQLIACAGSGKTEVVAQRVAALLKTDSLVSVIFATVLPAASLNSMMLCGMTIPTNGPAKPH